MSVHRRCGVTSAGGVLGRCRPEGHPGDDHCAHVSDRLTGEPGRIVVGRGPLGRSFASCDGTRNPAGDRLVHSIRPGAVENRFELIVPTTEGETP